MTYDPYKKYHLNKVINASGKMTILGVSKLSESTKIAQQYGGSNFFEMDDLLVKTGNYIADLLSCEDATIVSSASAGIALSVAGLIGKGSLYHLYHPYSNRILKREIIIPKGHNVDYGTAVEVMIEQGGGTVVEAGYANMCTADHIISQVTDNTAAILYVKSHHTVQKSMLSVEEAIAVAKKVNIPIIIDAAAESDIKKYAKMGSDLVIFSGAKAIEGPSSGLVFGNQKAIQWVRLQSKGIGRSMKIGKENILGFSQAVEDYILNGSEDGESMKMRLQPFLDKLNNIDGIVASESQDPAGREIYRAKVQPMKRKTASELVNQLTDGSPAIYTRNYLVNQGIIEFDIRAVNKEEMDCIVEKITKIMNS
ncbi:L-seryl-tRNA(Ser) seleniumtransferase [Granulicatella balaenopterae]|uniref:L-seryl-tRNA(Ser) seleniumtransferase n=1 Tax=Granulicatella balaenopterae TaxID=137733 RepID=A0A1H9NWW1_9LACT|nr:DgaE family pyridoxal phosphate-dependent ammonia lyase [Granulicatella balaenopterae]SER40287.1 L-seryl-tRNA(Ser) seleniumtransferase [Granulicatella balaenopterae]